MNITIDTKKISKYEAQLVAANEALNGVVIIESKSIEEARNEIKDELTRVKEVCDTLDKVVKLANENPDLIQKVNEPVLQLPSGNKKNTASNAESKYMNILEFIKDRYSVDTIWEYKNTYKDKKVSEYTQWYRGSLNRALYTYKIQDKVTYTYSYEDRVCYRPSKNTPDWTYTVSQGGGGVVKWNEAFIDYVLPEYIAYVDSLK